MIHKWEKKSKLAHTHNHESAVKCLGCCWLSYAKLFLSFLSFPHPSLSLSIPLPPSASLNERSASLNATSGAQIKSFTVHREKRRLATMQPLGNQCVFSKLRHHRLLWHLIRCRRGAVQMCETCFLAASKGWKCHAGSWSSVASPLTPALSSLSAAASICCSRMCGTFYFCLGVPKWATVMNKESGDHIFLFNRCLQVHWGVGLKS